MEFFQIILNYVLLYLSGGFPAEPIAIIVDPTKSSQVSPE